MLNLSRQKEKKIVGSSSIIDLITPANISNFYETMVSISFHTTENEIQVLWWNIFNLLW